MASWSGYTKIVQKLIEAGVNVNVSKNKHTVLHYACDQGQLEVVKLLLEKGADVNAKNEEGETPLDIAKKTSNKEIIKLFENK